MTDDYTPTTDELRAQWAATWHPRNPEAADASFDRWLAALRAEWEAEQGETLRQVEKFLADAEEVGQITDPYERFGTPAEKAAGVVDRAWRQGLRLVLGPAPGPEAEGGGLSDGTVESM